MAGARNVGFNSTAALGSVVDVSTAGISPSSSEPSLAIAQATAEKIESLLGQYRTIRFTVPGDYYFAGAVSGGAATDYSAIALPATMRHIEIAPGVRLLRHSGYSSGARGLGNLFAFAQVVTENEGVIIDGGGTIGRMKATGADNQNTVEFANAEYVRLENLTFQTVGANCTGKYSILTTGIDRLVTRTLRFLGDETASSSKSDGLHCHGRHGTIDVDGVTGATTDNMIGIGLDEGPNYLVNVAGGFQGGNIDSVSIRNVFTTLTQAEPVRFFGWQTNNLAITGATYSEPGGVFTITKTGGFASILQFQGAVASGDIVMTLAVTGGTGITPATYTIASIISADAITITADAGSATADLTATTITTSGKFREIHVDGVGGSVASGVTSGVGLAYDTGLTNGVMEDVLIENVSIFGGAASGTTSNVIISAGGAIRVTCRNIRPQGNGTHGHTAVRVFNNATGLKYLAIEDCRSDQPTTATASAHLIDFSNGTGGGAFTIDQLVLANNELKTANSSNASCFLTTDGMAAGAVTFANITGTNNRMECAASTVSRFFMLANITLGARITSASLANTTIKNVYLLVDAAGVGSTGNGERSSLTFDGLNILSSMSNGLWGRVDVTAFNVYRDHKGAWVTNTRTGNPSFQIPSQESVIVLGYGVANTTSNDFSGIVATSGNLDVNGLTRYANVMGQGFLPRGYQVHETHWKHQTQLVNAGSSAVTVKLGTTVDTDQFTSATGYTTWLSAAVATGTFHAEIPAAASGESATANAQTDTDTNTDRNLNLNVANTGANWSAATAGRIAIRIRWSMRQTST